MRGYGFFIIACLAAIPVPWLPIGIEAGPGDALFPGWPNTYEDRTLTERRLSPKEERFLKTFPGRMAKFSDGRRLIIMRWITTATRKLHPAADCFRAKGYSVRPLPIHIDSRGGAWGRIQCSRSDEQLVVRQRIYNAGGNWTDVSSWYWAALLRRTDGPWRMITVVEGTTQVAGD
ncbi:hypothetical protein ACFL2Q_01090 [Thermodesulfobacteriota bacterium]